MKKSDYNAFDYLIGMDHWNIKNMKRITGGDPGHKIYKLLEFVHSDRDVADPWYTGDFDSTWEDVSKGCQALLEYVLEHNVS